MLRSGISPVADPTGSPPNWRGKADAAIRHAVRFAITYLPPRRRGMRLARMVDRALPPDPHQRLRARVPGGAEITVNAADKIQACIFYTGVYEPEVTQMLRAELRAGDVFLDVGANVGYFSLLASKLCGLDGAVHAFEPEPTLAARLRHDARKLGAGSAPVIVHNVAALARSGRVSLVGPAEAARQLGEGYVEDRDPGDRSALPAVSIDELMPDLRFDVAKIDVEGAEVQVVQGASQAILRSSPRLLLIEGIDANLARFGSSVDELVAEMAALGYHGTLVESKCFAPMFAFRPVTDGGVDRSGDG